MFKDYTIEDYAIEEISRFSNIEDALNFFRRQRIEIKNFLQLKELYLFRGYQKSINKLNDKKQYSKHQQRLFVDRKKIIKAKQLILKVKMYAYR